MPDGRKLLRCAVTPRNDLTLGTDSTITSPAAGLACSPCASGTFSAPFFEAGDWNHILLTFDPSGELPVWELYVNGKSAGRVTSVWRGASVDYGGLFGLGEGSFDMWRVSKRVLSVEESLYRSRPGLWIVIR